MKAQLKTAVVAGAVNSLVVTGGYGLFMATVPADALWRMVGMAPGSPLAAWQVVLASLLSILSGPLCWLCYPQSTGAFVCLSAVSAFVWGTCLALVFYAISQKLHKRRA
jgi:hypothetical protein